MDSDDIITTQGDSSEDAANGSNANNNTKNTVPRDDALFSFSKNATYTCITYGKSKVNQMIKLDYFNYLIPQDVMRFIDEKALAFRRIAQTCEDSDALVNIKIIVNAAELEYPHIKSVFDMTYSKRTNKADKIIHWTICTFFMVCYIEHHTQSYFKMPMDFDELYFHEFDLNYPEFRERTWNKRELCNFKLVMTWVLKAFGKKENLGYTVELVTLMTAGTQTAMHCNTMGGPISKASYNDAAAKIAEEKCRVLIYRRESGTQAHPRNQDKIKKIKEKSLDKVYDNANEGVNGDNLGILALITASEALPLVKKASYSRKRKQEYSEVQDKNKEKKNEADTCLKSIQNIFNIGSTLSIYNTDTKMIFQDFSFLKSDATGGVDQKFSKFQGSNLC
jgi:hypothetical protein